HLLDKDREAGGRLAATLERAVRSIRNCERCRMLTEEPVCRFCGSDKRDRSQLCVVETPADLLAIEQSGAYRGSYFVLMGHLSPIDGIGPAELGLPLLERRFVAELAQKHGLKASRIAYGVPVGGELEYIDGGTLARALRGRREIDAAGNEGGR